MAGESFANNPMAGSGMPWIFRATAYLLTRLRPYLGWFLLVGCAGMAAFPALGIEETRWLGLHRTGGGILWTGPLGVLLAWLVLGWRRPFLDARRKAWWARGLQLLVALSLLTVAAFLVLSQLSVQWAPGPGRLLQTARQQSWPLLGQQMIGDFTRLADHYMLWWQGVQGEGAAQDNLVFAGLAGFVFWWIGVLTAWLARRFRSGFLAALPALWLLSLILLYANRGRLLLVAALALALFVHLLLDQAELFRRWRERGIDYSPSLRMERFIPAIGVAALILLAAAVMPSPGINALAWRYYEMVEPANQQGKAMIKRLFPDLRAGGGIFGRAVAGGLPNQFLITSADDLGEAEVMRVRTNESAALYDEPAPGHYMRSATFALYDGLGWDNPPRTDYTAYDANHAWDMPRWAGRRPLVQQVFLTFNSQVIYAAAEPLEPGIEYRAETRTPGDLATLRARARTYTVISQVAAVAPETLAAAPGWSADRPLPDDYAVHLSLPETVTARTRALATELTGDLETPFAKAQTLERYLRAYEYDLDVPLPPSEVTDVVDYFLFDLERGYCDYYATAFVVLARLADLPTRFVTGFVVGQWDAEERLYVVTEAEAHSWPEVYFPDYGWIAFEPTGGRPELARAAPPAAASGDVTTAPMPELDLSGPAGIPWNWEMLVWLIPLGLLAWGGVWLVAGWRRRREDPWSSLLKWGAQRGRPMHEQETTLEYGHVLGEHIIDHATRTPDAGRVAAREVVALSDDVTTVHYGPEASRPSAMQQASTRWARLRAYLRRLRLGDS